MKKKIKKEWRRGVGPRAIYGNREAKLLDKEAEYVIEIETLKKNHLQALNAARAEEQARMKALFAS